MLSFCVVYRGCRPDAKPIKLPDFTGKLKPEQREIALGLAVSLVLALAWWTVPSIYLPLVFAGLPVGIWLALRHTYLLCLLFVLFSFFRIHEAVPVLINLKIPQLLAMASLAGVFWHWQTGGMRFYLTRELRLLLIFLLVVWLSVIFSTHRLTSLGHFNGVFIKIVAMTFVLTWLCDSQRKLQLTMAGIVGVGMLIAGIAIYNKLNGIDIIEGSRVTIGRNRDSVLGDPNDLGVVLLFPLSFSLALLLTPRLQAGLRVLGVGSAGMLCWAILATQSRGSMLGVMAVFAAIGWQRVRNKALMLGVVTVLSVGLYALSGTGERASAQAVDGALDMSAQGRLNAWGTAVNMALGNPLTGVGLDMFLENYFDYTEHWDGRPHAVHSSWFGVLAETGFVGFFVFVALNWMILSRTYRLSLGVGQDPAVPRTIAVMALALFSGLVGNAVSGSFLSHAFLWPFYVLLALCLALARVVENEQPQWRQPARGAVASQT